jgi:hypothetical protein
LRLTLHRPQQYSRSSRFQLFIQQIKISNIQAEVNTIFISRKHVSHSTVDLSQFLLSEGEMGFQFIGGSSLHQMKHSLIIRSNLFGISIFYSEDRMEISATPITLDQRLNLDQYLFEQSDLLTKLFPNEYIV